MQPAAYLQRTLKIQNNFEKFLEINNISKKFKREKLEENKIKIILLTKVSVIRLILRIYLIMLLIIAN